MTTVDAHSEDSVSSRSHEHYSNAQLTTGVVIASRPPRSRVVSAVPPSAPAADPAGAAVRELILCEQARCLYRHHPSRESTSIGSNHPSRTLLRGTPLSPPWLSICDSRCHHPKHPEKESYRRKCVLYYDELCDIFGDNQTTGGNAITGNEANMELPSLEEMCNAEKSLPIKEEKDEVNHSSSSATRTRSSGQRTKRKKSSNIDATEQGLTAAANRLADTFTHIDCARLQKELHNIPELSRENVMRAMLLLGGSSSSSRPENEKIGKLL
ncbi:hypothetical protein Syun_009810 [Stephania yunnanensis]|uniref:Uncharacterized protein n=1 Tax=Stephania yunnanensis TaxID=152371 RepID=A0AAP0KF85_9MAGN